MEIIYDKNHVFWMPNKCAQKQFRIELQNGQWKTLTGSRKSITKQFLKYQPETIFYNTLDFLQPRNVSNKETIDQGIVIGESICLDFDGQYAKERAIYAYYQLKDTYRITYILNSGRGYHLLIKQTLTLPFHPKERRKYLEQKRKIFIKQNLELLIETKVDFAPIHSLNSFIRLPSSFNKRSRNYAHFITPKRRDIDDWPAIRSSLEAEDDHGCSVKNPHDMYAAKPETGQRACCIYLTNEVGKRFIPIFKYDNEKMAKKEIKYLQRIYKLGTIYLVSNGAEIYGFSLHPLPHERLLKIMAKSRALNKTNQEKYHKSFLKVHPTSKLLTTLKQDKKGAISTPHTNYLEINFGIHAEGTRTKEDRMFFRKRLEPCQKE